MTDSEGLSDSAEITVTVNAAGGGGITLTATPKTQGRLRADLRWNGANGSKVDIYRDGVFLIGTPNDGAYNDRGVQSGVTFTYQVRETGTTTCSTNTARTRRRSYSEWGRRQCTAQNASR